VFNPPKANPNDKGPADRLTRKVQRARELQERLKPQQTGPKTPLPLTPESPK
jgi:hypothetical protein